MVWYFHCVTYILLLLTSFKSNMNKSEKFKFQSSTKFFQPPALPTDTPIVALF